MGLDVGVVSIDYLNVPDQPMYGFMQSLTDDWEIWDIYPQAPEDYIWGTIWEGNAVLEIERVNLLNRAWRWAEQTNRSFTERIDLLNWVDNLPYRGDTIMLHLGF